MIPYTDDIHNWMLSQQRFAQTHRDWNAAVFRCMRGEIDDTEDMLKIWQKECKKLYPLIKKTFPSIKQPYRLIEEYRRRVRRENPTTILY